MTIKDFKEEKINSKKIYEGKILTLTVDNVRMPNGRDAVREIIIHNGGITVVAQPNPEKVVLIRQFRYAIGKVFWELPAGRLNVNEDPLFAAKRELKEETGFLAKAWEPLGIVYPLPGYSTEVLYFFKATELTDDEQDLDPDENIEVKVTDLKQAWQMVKDGEIRDAKTIAGISLVMF
ncbi:MAG: NUDIX hydrolase [Candidatus Melainabacteria bacterium]|nr:NUDIX hydrolase [Candidatus Melainabacteria bacterium]